MTSALDARRCLECGKLSVEEHRCAFCGSERGEHVRLSGRGTLISWTTIRVAPARYAAEAPYTVGVVSLEEGLRLTARVSGDPERFTAGQPVELTGVDPLRGPVFESR